MAKPRTHADGTIKRKPPGYRKEQEKIVHDATWAGMTPLEYMLTIMRNKDAAQSRRDAMAIAAAPYCHPKFAVLAYQPTGNDNEPKRVNRIERVFIEDSSGSWSDVTDSNDAGVPVPSETS